MSTSDPAIVTQATGETKPNPPTEPPAATLPGPRSEPQSFTIRCAGCDGDEGLHVPNCPGVIAIGYDSGTSAASMAVYPEPGSNLGKHSDALGSFRFYSIFGPVELHMEDGTVISFDDPVF